MKVPSLWEPHWVGVCRKGGPKGHANSTALKELYVAVTDAFRQGVLGGHFELETEFT